MGDPPTVPAAEFEHMQRAYTRQQQRFRELLLSEERQRLLRQRQPPKKSCATETVNDEELVKDWAMLFKDKKYADFTIHCRATGADGGQMCQLRAHKLVLAVRSPFFAALLEPHTAEAQASEVHLDDISAEVMDAVLCYMYTGQTANLKQMAMDLFEVADRFQLIGLKTKACQVIRASITNDNVCRVLVLADMHNEVRLKPVALRFFAKNAKAVIKTDGWLQMMKDHPQLATEAVAELSENGGGSSVSFGGSPPPAKRGRTRGQLIEPDQFRNVYEDPFANVVHQISIDPSAFDEN